MSFEGYEQLLCGNGHYSTLDVYSMPDDESWACPECGAKLAWRHTVDQTNGYDENLVVKLEEERPAQSCMCDCGNSHESSPAVYKIPGRNPLVPKGGRGTMGSRVPESVPDEMEIIVRPGNIIKPGIGIIFYAPPWKVGAETEESRALPDGRVAMRLKVSWIKMETAKNGETRG